MIKFLIIISIVFVVAIILVILDCVLALTKIHYNCEEPGTIEPIDYKR